jgi:hypothetical protein
MKNWINSLKCSRIPATEITNEGDNVTLKQVVPEHPCDIPVDVPITGREGKFKWKGSSLSYQWKQRQMECVQLMEIWNHYPHLEIQEVAQAMKIAKHIKKDSTIQDVLRILGSVDESSKK